MMYTADLVRTQATQELRHKSRKEQEIAGQIRV